MTIKAETNGIPYTFELQLNTQCAAIAADLEHNTIFKPYVPLSPEETGKIKSMLSEAAALDQAKSGHDMAVTTTAGKYVYLYIFWVLRNDRRDAVCVIDCRRCGGTDVTDSLANEAMAEFARLRIPVELELVVPDEDEPSLRLPSWEEYHTELVNLGERPQ